MFKNCTDKLFHVTRSTADFKRCEIHWFSCVSLLASNTDKKLCFLFSYYFAPS